MSAEHLVEIKNLTIQAGEQLIVNNVSLSVAKNNVMALVGGSGSGKTTTALSILKLLSPALKIQQGNIIYNSKDLLLQNEAQLRMIRGKEIAMIFQEPLYAFNPVFTIGSQIDEVLRHHMKMNGKQRRNRILELLDQVGITDPDRVAKNYPHQLSGGMRQRAMIAQAIAAGPRLIIADEPTSNLDVTLQARIMDLFRDLRKQLGLSVLLITHDLGMVGHMADEVVVMSKGEVIEKGMAKDILNNPQHEYTKQLLQAVG